MATETNIVKTDGMKAVMEEPLTPKFFFQKQYLNKQGNPVRHLKDAATVKVTTHKECKDEVVKALETPWFEKQGYKRTAENALGSIFLGAKYITPVEGILIEYMQEKSAKPAAKRVQKPKPPA